MSTNAKARIVNCRFAPPAAMNSAIHRPTFSSRSSPNLPHTTRLRSDSWLKGTRPSRTCGPARRSKAGRLARRRVVRSAQATAGTTPSPSPIAMHFRPSSAWLRQCDRCEVPLSLVRQVSRPSGAAAMGADGVTRALHVRLSSFSSYRLVAMSQTVSYAFSPPAPSLSSTARKASWRPAAPQDSASITIARWVLVPP